MLFIPGKTTIIQVSQSVQGLRLHLCAREICFNHQSEALPKFYVIEIHFQVVLMAKIL